MKQQEADPAGTSTARPGWWTRLPPAAGSAVMATGIVSIGLYIVGRHVLSTVLLVLTAALWVLLGLAFALTFLRDRRRWVDQADTPPALTAVAATAVLGTRLSLSGWQWAAAALLLVATAAWPGLLGAVLAHWKRRRMPGAAFLVCVATEGLAVLAATLALAGHGAWLVWPALVTFVLGLVLYVAAFVRFDPRQLETGHGDQWIAAGALSISALAASKLTSWTAWTGGAHAVLRDATLVLLALSLAGYVVLLASEVHRPRFDFDIRRWATVFPLGMTAVATLNTATAAHLSWLRPLGHVLLWIAVAAWLITAVLHIAGLTRRPRPRP